MKQTPDCLFIAGIEICSWFPSSLKYVAILDAPAGPLYSALRRETPIDTEASDLEKLIELTEQCRDCQVSKQPNI